MTTNLSSWIAVLFGLSLLLAALSLLVNRGTRRDSYSTPARFFLIALRLAIGWHFFIEGAEKLHTASWSSEPYLREAIGPLASTYHRLAGDRLLDKLTAVNDKELPPTLEHEWQAYYDAFFQHYGLSLEQQIRAEGRFEAAKLRTAEWLSKGKEDVVIIAPYPPELKVPLTVKERLDKLAYLQDRVRDAESRLPSNNAELQKRYKDAKADLARWRGGLKKSLDAQTAKMKDALKSVLFDDYTFVCAALAPSIYLRQLPTAATMAVGQPLFAHVSAQSPQDAVPEPIRLPRKYWQLLEYSDAGVTWGLIVLGGALMLGLFSRLASAAGALLVLSFYLAMPPLPGYPEVPRAEGHYLIINKTLIEALALGALAFIPTGRWAGVDGLLCTLCPWCRSEAATPG
jgi:uncharacterized membrane protein YphA (DoxX/SURF4 family)